MHFARHRKSFEESEKTSKAQEKFEHNYNKQDTLKFKSAVKLECERQRNH